MSSMEKNVKKIISTEFMAKWLPGLLFLSVLCNQIILVHNTQLSAWQGGGFGMFATMDKPLNRALTLTGYDSEGKSYEIYLNERSFERKSTLKDLYLRALVQPKGRSLKNLAQELLESKFVPMKLPNFDKLNEQRLLERAEFKNETINAIHWLRPLPEKQSTPETASLVELQRIHIVVLRLSFDFKTIKFMWEPLSSIRGEVK